jgi:tetratricopeptide (TPR) repeat protein
MRLGNAEPSALRACANVLRAFDQSAADDAQGILRRLLARAAIDAEGDPGRLHDKVLETVGRLLDRLSQRQRDILSRCDGYGENAATVARSLSISRRHLFRERRDALNLIACSVLAEAPLAVRAEELPEPIAHWQAQLKLATLLQDRGNWRAAADVLERLVGEPNSPESRGLVEGTLARLYLRVDRLTLAAKHASAARSLATRTTSGRKWRTAEAEVVIARVEHLSLRIESSDRLAARSISALRSWIGGSEPRIYNALLEALILREDIATGKGNVELATRLMAEARQLSEFAGIDRGLKICVRAFAAVSGNVTGDLTDPEPALLKCYQEALMYGLADEACGMAALLGSAYRRRGRPDSAIELLTPLIGLATDSPFPQHMRMVYELVNALIDVGDLAAAQRDLQMLSSLCSTSTDRQGIVRLTSARFHQAAGEFELALSDAEVAETIYSQLGLDRLVAEALLAQARALLGLQNEDRARRVLLPAIEMIESTSGPKSAAAAYALLDRSKFKRGRIVKRFAKPLH